MLSDQATHFWQPSSATRRDLLRLGGLACATALLTPVLSGCGGSDTDAQTQMRQLLGERWQNRYAGQAGGLSLNMITPYASYFASTLDGITADAHFRAASTTKTFTAAAIMLLDQRGLLRIDDLITASMPGRTEPYLPNTPDYAIPYKDQISIRQLLSHRAGVFDITNQAIPTSSNADYAGWLYHEWREEQNSQYSHTKDELIKVLADNQLSNAAPGERFQYSDSHYQILGKVIEQVSDKTLNAFISEELLQTNGLTRSHFVIDGANQQLPAPFIDGYALFEAQTIACTEYNYSYDPGSGNLVTSLADLSRWIRRLMKGQAGINAAQVARMCEVLPDSNYGLGTMHLINNGNDLGYGHNGGTAGYMTYAFHDPVTDLSFIIQCSLLDVSRGKTSLAQQGSWLCDIVFDIRSQLGYTPQPLR